MMELLEYEFIRNALFASLLISICSGIIGTLCVVNKSVFLAGGLAHGAYGGIGIALFFGFSITLGASIFTLFLALILSYLLLHAKERIDAIIGVIWAVGMALGIILIDLTPGYNADFMSYLFGSIMAISKEDLYIATLYDIALLLFVALFYRAILGFSYDADFARLKSINTELLSLLILLFIALGVVISMRAVGLILIIALLSIPAYMAERLSRSLFEMMCLASLLSWIFIIIGLALSYFYDLTSGAVIIMVAAFAFILLLVGQTLYKRVKR
ncbi:MAG: metal ABC transporter permease [Wolinella sp.]